MGKQVDLVTFVFFVTGIVKLCDESLLSSQGMTLPVV
jgi:hypothetical protein